MSHANRLNKLTSHLHFHRHPQWLASSLGRVATALAVIALAGCAAAPQIVVTPITRTSERVVAGVTFKVIERAVDPLGPVLSKSYNGEPSGTASAPTRVRAMAWFDYDSLMVSYYLRNVDAVSSAANANPNANPNVNAGSVLPVVIPAGGDFYAESLKFWGVTTLAGKLLGFRTGLSVSTAGLGLVTGLLGDADTWFMIAAKKRWTYRVGSSLTLIGVHTAQDLRAASGYENAIAQAAAIFAAVDMTPPAESSAGHRLLVSPHHGAVDAAPLVYAVGLQADDPSRVAPDKSDHLTAAYTRNFRTWHQSPLAHGREANAGWTEVRIPHVSLQARADNIRSPRELYEKKVLPSGAMPDGWFAIYTDVDPSDGKRKIFVSRKGDNRTLTFPVPEKPSN